MEEESVAAGAMGTTGVVGLEIEDWDEDVMSYLVIGIFFFF